MDAAAERRGGIAMPQAVWTGQLSFGLVNIPVKLYNATSPRKVRFHHYDSASGRRIRYRRVATGPALEDRLPASTDAPSGPRHGPEEEPGLPPEPQGPVPERIEDARPRPEQSFASPETSEEEPEVPWADVVKGFEIEPGRIVTVTPEELSSVAPERSRVLEIEQFVGLSEIDPVHFDKSYYLVPETGASAERPYRLLYRALEAAGEVAVGRFVLRTKEHLAAVRPGDEVLVLETLFYADEVRAPKELWFSPAQEPPERELGIARQFVESLAGHWDPSRHRDEYRERLLELLRSKAGDARAVTPEVKEDEFVSPAIDLMEALKASVEAAKAARAAQRKTG
jgi:DNA end-binding protein Ku